MADNSEPSEAETQPKKVVKAYMHRRLVCGSDETDSQLTYGANEGGDLPAPGRSTLPPWLLPQSAVEEESAATLSLEEIYQDSELARQRFEDAMKTYEMQAPEKYKTGVLRGGNVHTWDEVLEHVTKAQDHYYDTSSRWGKVRKRFRSFGKNSDAFSGWVNLLPSQNNYISVMCGGLKLIINAAGKLNDTRETIMQTLEDIPSELSCIQTDLGTFKDSKQLHQRCNSLFTTIIATLDHVLGWYSQKAFKRLASSLFKQDAYEAALVQKTELIKIESSWFRRTAEAFNRRVTQNTKENLQNLHKENRAGQLFIANGIDYMQQTQEGTNQEIRQLREELSNLKRALYVAQGKFYASNGRLNHRTQDDKGPFLPVESRRTPPIDLSILDSLLAINDKELSSMLSMISSLPAAESNRFGSILIDPLFQSWFTAPYSCSLFVNGNSSAISARCTATSCVAAKLIDTIKSRDDSRNRSSSTHVIFRFCGSQRTKSTGLAGTLKSLIAQIISSCSIIPEGNVMRRVVDERYDDVAKLGKTLCKLLSQLEKGCIVFCILDCVTEYEGRSFQADEDESEDVFVKDLTEMTRELRDWGKGPTLKLLLTCPWESRRFWKYVRDQREHVVWMPSSLSRTHEWNERSWQAMAMQTN